MPIAELVGVNHAFMHGLPLTNAAVQFATRRHARELPDRDGLASVHHPLEVAAMLRMAGYPDAVVASGALHDVLEDTPTDVAELAEHFGPTVARLVQAVSEDASIADRDARKSALREKVARGPTDAVAVFAADKVSKTRQLRSQLTHGIRHEQTDARLDHYRASLSISELRLGRGHVLVEPLRFELELVSTLV